MQRLAALVLTALVAGLVLAPGAAPAPTAKRALVTWEVTGERFRTYSTAPRMSPA